MKALKVARHMENEHRTKVDDEFGVMARRQNTTAEKLKLARSVSAGIRSISVI